MSAVIEDATAMFTYRVPSASIWTAGLTEYDTVHPIVGEPSLPDLLDKVGQRRYGAEWARLRRTARRSLSQIGSSSGLALLTGRGWPGYVRIGKLAWLTVAAEVAELVFDPNSTLGRADGRRPRDREPMVSYVGSLMFRFSFHSAPEEGNRAVVVSASHATRYTVRIPRSATEPKRGGAAAWVFSPLHVEGLPLDEDGTVAARLMIGSGTEVAPAVFLEEPAPEATARRTTVLLASHGSSPSWRTVEGEQQFLLGRPAANDPISSATTCDLAVLRPETPVGDGLWEWARGGETEVNRVEALLRRAGSGSSAVVAVLVGGRSDVDQYHVTNEDGMVYWRREASDLVVGPPREATSGAYLILDANGKAWTSDDGGPGTMREDPADDPADDVPVPVLSEDPATVPERAPSNTQGWTRSDDLTPRLLVARSDTVFRYFVDAEGEIWLASAKNAAALPSADLVRVSGELSWSGGVGGWKVDDGGGWQVDEDVHADLEAAPDLPATWLGNVAARLTEHLGVRVSAAPAVEQGPRLWGEAGPEGVRRLEARLHKAGPGARAVVAAFRPGSTQVDRYQAANHDGRIEWTSGLTGAPVEPPLDAVQGASVVYGPDGSPVSESRRPMLRATGSPISGGTI
ncbi:hypothetical protein [Pseudonocardia spinosispora]|uniref:hypothetical protein n=1 Tax=Pseudonocardia spinosispora TaxID=103441 RepID=UPI00146F9800|nr:hypothetical protein [Pseudonocardia spinosispora]